MAYRAVIFDLDGTLANTLEDIADAMNRTLAASGYPVHSLNAYRLMVGNGLKNLVTVCLPESARTASVIDRCHARVVADYGEHYIVKSRLYDGIEELLNKLSLKGVKMAVLSNKADAITQKICRTLLDHWKFDAIMGMSERFPRKPDPQSSRHIAAGMDVAPSEVCYVGDSDVDMKTALAAGFFPVGVAWGFRPEKELADNGARKIIRFPTELLSVVFSDDDL
ncbi:MAG: HAD family hydrolase [Bacteroidales bacterium]|jgi:phosphoglycolate phosphatase|nr:HAD family hydrolase [Bacteroidales bacterium]